MGKTKVIAGVGLGLVVLLAVAGYFLLSNLNGIIKGVIEDVGSRVVQTPVTLDAVELDLRTGVGRLRGLTIANPAGYESEHAFRLNDVVVAIAPASLTGKVIVVSEVKIDGANLIAEQKGSKTNLSELLSNIEKSADKSPETPQEETGPTGAPVRLMIEQFAFINTEAKLISELADEKSLKIPDVRRSNIGDKETGLTPEQLTQELLRSLVKSVQDAVSQQVGKLATDALEKKLSEKLSDENKAKLDGLKSIFKKK